MLRSPRLRKSDLLGLALVLFLVALAFADILSTKRALYDRDIAWVAMPERAALRDAARDGFPFWNPRFAAGQPLAANPAFAVFYPPHWLVLLPNFLFACAAETAAHFLLAAAGMFLLLRSLRLRVEAAAFGAVTYAWSGVLLSLTNVPPYLFAMTWWPWLGFFANRFFERRRRADFALAALALGMIILAGEPATILESGALLGAFASCRLQVRPALGWTAAICAAALFVGAATLIPAADFARDTSRGTAIDYDSVTRWSLEPAAPLELAGVPIASSDPTGRPWVASWYCGMLVPALLIAGFVHRVRGWQFAAAIAAIGYTLALGRHAPFLRLLYLAGLKAIRFPEKWFLPVAFVLIVFATIAADRVLDDAHVRRTAHIAAAALIFVNAVAGMSISVAVAVALTLILFARGRLLLLLLAAFVVADLGARTHTVAPRIDGAFYTDVPAIARGLSPRARIYHDGNWQAYAAQRPPSTDRMHHGMYPDMQALWGFDGVLEPDVAMLNLRPTADFLKLFIQARFGPRHDLVPMLLSFAGVTHVIDANDRVVPLPNQKFTIRPAPSRIERVRETASTVDADVDAAGRALFVIAITPHKYWRATIDGAPAPLVRANIGFQAVEVPPGRHHVALRYRNPLIVVCGIVSLIAALALAATAATGLRR